MNWRRMRCMCWGWSPRSRITGRRLGRTSRRRVSGGARWVRKTEEAWALTLLCRVALGLGDGTLAAQHAEQALALFRDVGHPSGIATALSSVGGNCPRPGGGSARRRGVPRSAPDLVRNRRPVADHAGPCGARRSGGGPRSSDDGGHVGRLRRCPGARRPGRRCFRRHASAATGRCVGRRRISATARVTALHAAGLHVDTR